MASTDTDPAAAAPAQPAPWGYWATLGWAVLALLIGEIVAGVVVGWWREGSPVPLLEARFNAVEIALNAFVSIPVQIGLLAFVARRAHWRVADYFGLVWPKPRELAFGLAAIIIVGALWDSVLHFTGREIISPFQVDALRTARAAGWVPLLWLAIVVFAPIGEEVLFRGFLFRGWIRRKKDVAYAILLTTLLWTALHVQYDLVGIAQVFCAGLLFGWFRWTSGSTILAILMHAFMNLISMIETVILAPAGP